jgi:hypothetical protein
MNFFTKRLLKNIIFLFLFISCSDQTKNINETFIVPTLKTKPPPPVDIYLPFNFIVDSSGKIFYYQQQIIFGSDDVDEELPAFINLKPKDIVQIPTNNIEDFIKLNILSNNNSEKLVAIALSVDTIKSKSFLKIRMMFNDPSNHVKWLIRKVTEEEKIVLQYKEKNKNYYPSDIRWDSTKIRFPITASGR